MTDKKLKVNKVPNLRFPGFEGEWKEFSIGKILKIGSGKDYKHLSNGDIPVFGTGGYMSSVNKYLFDGETVCIGRKGTINKPFYFNGKFWTVDTLFFTHSFQNVIPKFVFYVFEQINWLKYNEASGVPSLSKTTIEQILISIPNINEQKKIASILSTIDERIQTQNEIIQRYESLMKGLSQKLFTQKLKFEDEKSVKDCIWDKRKLGALTFKVGKKNKENLSYPIYSINNKEGFLPQNQQFGGMDSNERGYDISLYKIIKSKTFAYNPARINVGSIGFSGELNEIIISSLYVCFKTNKELEDNYLLHYLDSYHFNKSVLRNVEGGVRQYLFYENFSSIKIPLPSKGEQSKIANFLDLYKEKIAIEKNLLESLKSQKQYFLQQLFI